MAMKSFAIFALASAAAASTLGEWSIYCGDSCSDGTLVASGTVAPTGSCISLGGSYDYCYVETEDEIYTDFWEAFFYENTECLLDTGNESGMSNAIFGGSCTPLGPWTEYQLHGNA